MPLGCFGLHDWSTPFPDPFSSVYQPLIQCLACKMIQRYYAHNMVDEISPEGDYDIVQQHQQGFNIRPEKPYFDV